MMKRLGLASVLSASLALAGCDSTGAPGSDASSYCQQNPAVCILIGAVVVGGVVGLVAANNHHSSTPPPVMLSDARLKTDIRSVSPINGIPLHSYKYIGDDRVFVGVLAQELLANPAWRKAVRTGPDGYYRVDYAALGLEIDNATTLQIAGEDAARRMPI